MYNLRCVTSTGEGDDLYRDVLRIITPSTTRFAPDDWRRVINRQDAKSWLEDRLAESPVYVVKQIATSAAVGFIFLHPIPLPLELTEWRLGYILGESYWSQGLGTELMEGIIGWARQNKGVAKISCGVARENAASVKMLERNNFHLASNHSGTVFYEYPIEQAELQME
ncbi:GNAT family N-acetyltransferase [Hahella chejuensis]|uniref:GNAT family N-acetyltransferase n=1 Tax=Hahella chejuensis TaxID=158327 RepID=UPI001305476F|nr:GNAT family N-acetyltransferase [Hahella chejuensis]